MKNPKTRGEFMALPVASGVSEVEVEISAEDRDRGFCFIEGVKVSVPKDPQVKWATIMKAPAFHPMFLEGDGIAAMRDGTGTMWRIVAMAGGNLARVPVR